MKIETMDGNEAAAYASYAFTEVAAIYPITPSTPMAEGVDEWSAYNKKNLFGQRVKLVEMQSEAGAAGAMHGSLAAGAFATTYTASQGLLLMIPNLYKMAGELLPGVLHVSARAIATHALSIFGDHQDVMACRQTGVALLASTNGQEAMDLGCIAHLSAIKSRIPFIHFFDGFRTSHEYRKVNVLEYSELSKLLDHNAINQFRDRALSPNHPVARGTAQNPDIYFQGREASNKFYLDVPNIVQGYMEEIEKITSRKYLPFDYYGVSDADRIIVAMGSVCDTIEETIDYLQGRGEKIGLIKVRLYRPFSEKHFFNVLPSSVKSIAVLDRTKEPGSIGEPLYLDVCKAISSMPERPTIIGGRYGLGSKDTRPSQIIAVYDNLKNDSPKNGFTIGIVDDVTNTSLKEGEIVETTPEGTLNCKFWGLGSDGTVGANKTAIKIIGDNTQMNVQGYFSYDSKKSGGTTISHLRFGEKQIKSSYLVYNADYIACHNKSFLYHYDILKGLKNKGVFLLNCPWTGDDLNAKLPATIKKYIAENEINFYTINAEEIAREIGLGNRINMIMQSAFFKLTNVIPIKQATDFLKNSIEKTYGKKGQKIVEMNKLAVDKGIESVIKVDVPVMWKNATEDNLPINDINEPDFVKNIQRVMARDEGDELPVSAFNGIEDGTHPLGTTAYEKRGIAPMLPEWQIDKCIQCGQCSYICPHATVRLFLLNKEEARNAPITFKTKQATGKGLEDYQLRVQISPLDCTGCNNCADICPAKGKALIIKPAQQEINAENLNWEYAMSLSEKNNLMDKFSVKGSQLARPLLEFNGACPGCGETPYIKLLTQLYGERMMIANATGCSSIWGASSPSIAYSTNANGKGPAWANSLFEDNAEYGYGMFLGVEQIRERLYDLIKQALVEEVEEPLKNVMTNWIETMNDGEKSKVSSNNLTQLLEKYNGDNDIINEIKQKQDFLTKRSFWMIGGDGWAYDIGYGGLDHVLASGDDVNMFVLDTEIYSNTGGQASKSTPTGAVAKLAASGKKMGKKDLGMMAISYGYIYVAQIALGANMNQTIKAIKEAESFKGPSLIIAYSPCISHGIKTGMGTSILQQKKAIETGYWHLYRYNPDLKMEGKNPFQLDSKEPTSPYMDYIHSETRYSQLMNVFPDVAQKMFELSETNARERYNMYKKLSE